MKFKQSGLVYLWLTVVFLVLDQITKYWVHNSMALYESIDVLPFFNITYVRNTGAAFSFLANADGWQRWFFTIIALVVSVVIVFWLSKTPKSDVKLSVAFSLILSGAIGNVIDRLLFGYVIDFFDVYYKNYHWPAFNVADSVIFIGAVLLILDAIKPAKTTQAVGE